MTELWFLILYLMIAFFAVLEGWDFGAGALHYLVARNQEERRVLIAAIGPLWSWHEVWLVGTGGVLFVAFPRVLSTAFPAYYLALYLVLWTIILRGISLEFRGHIPHALWRSFWDFVFCASNVTLAILFGVAIGNVMRGLPLAPDAPLSLPLFTDFGVRGKVGLLDWYTLSVAVFTLICLSAHGASYLTIKTEGEIHRRSRGLAKWLWLSTFLLLILVSLETFYVRPQLLAGMSDRPLAWAGVAVVGGGLISIFAGLRSGAEHRAFLGGCALIAGLLGAAAASLFPVMLYSTVAPEYSMTALNGSSDASSLRAAACWWPVAFALALVYFSFIGKHYRGRVQLSKDTQRPY
jgi:cytochrome bd ubiquinol oxidase subunit II